MDPITRIGLILGLMPLYQREGDKRKQKNKDDFFKWLIEHNFQDLNELLSTNIELNNQIEFLLKMNHEELLLRFDELEKQLSIVLNKFDEFKCFGNLLSTIVNDNVEEKLSDQEISILKQFVDSGARTLIDLGTLDNPVCWQAGEVQINVKDVRFLNSNLERLSQLGLLSEQISKSGSSYYELTEAALDYIEKLKKNDLSEQAKLILNQVNDSNDLYLDILLDSKGKPMLIINGKSIDLADQNFLRDDLEMLLEKGYLKIENESELSTRYKLTRKGKENV